MSDYAKLSFLPQLEIDFHWQQAGACARSIETSKYLRWLFPVKGRWQYGLLKHFNASLLYTLFDKKILPALDNLQYCRDLMFGGVWRQPENFATRQQVVKTGGSAKSASGQGQIPAFLRYQWHRDDVVGG